MIPPPFCCHLTSSGEIVKRKEISRCEAMGVNKTALCSGPFLYQFIRACKCQPRYLEPWQGFPSDVRAS